MTYKLLRLTWTGHSLVSTARYTMSSVDSALVMHLLHLCLLAGISTCAQPFNYEAMQTGTGERNMAEGVRGQQPARETEEVSVPSSGRWKRGGTPREYRISVLKQHLVVKVTGGCRVMGSNAVIQTVDNGTVTSAVFADRMPEYCYEGRTRSPQPFRVILTSVHHVVTGIAVTGQDVVFFRPLPDQLSHTQSTHRIHRRATSSGSHSVSSGRSSWCNEASRNELKDVHLVPHLKVLVVVDKLTADRHDGSIENYVQTVMSIVQVLFSKQTAGSELNLSVVRLIVLRENLKELSPNDRARNTLREFCKWQKTLSSPTRHNLAIYLTGHDLCSGSTCDLEGLSTVNSICSSSASCMLVEDRGLKSAFTIAHHIGRVFGLNQDGRMNNCSVSKGHIMSPSPGTANIFRWSRCSKLELAASLRNATCLNEADFLNRVEHVLPGKTYNASQQCQLFRLHPGVVRACPHFYAQQGICGSLWCQDDHNSGCVTTNTPAADGTPCGHGNICMRGSCVDANCGGTSPSGSGSCPRVAEGQSVEISRVSDDNNSYMRWEITGRDKIRLHGTKLCVISATPRHNKTADLTLGICIGEVGGNFLRYNSSKSIITQKATHRCLTVTNSGLLLTPCGGHFRKQQKWGFRSSIGHVVSLFVRQQLSVCG